MSEDLYGFNINPRFVGFEATDSSRRRLSNKKQKKCD